MAPPLDLTDGNYSLIKENKEGPVFSTSLLPGEKVAVRNRRVLSRKGRNVVKVRIVGAGSLGWIEAARLWGAVIEMVITRGGNELRHLCELLNHDVYFTTPSHAATLPPHRVDWDGLILATIMNNDEADDLLALIRQWQPMTVMAYFHDAVSTSKRRNCMSYRLPCDHGSFGGVTNSRWHLHLRHRSNTHPHLSVERMTSSFYQRPFQTALDDTEGPSKYKSFEVASGIKDIVGLVVDKAGVKHPVYDSNGLAPNLAALSELELEMIYLL